jgi:hypothetical protein
MIVRIVLTLIVACLAATAQAQVQEQSLCPWLSAGSAKAALGGEVTVTAHSENNWEGTCRFTRQTAGVSQEIDIQVSRTTSNPCPGGSTKLKALGNEAVQCQRSMSSGEYADIIAGRVRDAYFVITASGLPQAENAPTVEHPADRYGASLLERLAEQVAGTLY